MCVTESKKATLNRLREEEIYVLWVLTQKCCQVVNVIYLVCWKEKLAEEKWKERLKEEKWKEKKDKYADRWEYMQHDYKCVI